MNEMIQTEDINTAIFETEEGEQIIYVYENNFIPTQEQINTANIDYLLMLQGEN